MARAAVYMGRPYSHFTEPGLKFTRRHIKRGIMTTCGGADYDITDEEKQLVPKKIDTKAGIAAYLLAKRKLMVQCIFTFRDRDQQVATVLLGRPKDNRDLVNKILKKAKVTRAELKSLAKISTMGLYTKASAYPRFIQNVDGKYYFKAGVLQ